jgi:pyruvate,water dikinase
MTSLVLPLRTDASVNEIGAKAARLSAVAKLGFLVPDGIILTTKAFRLFASQKALRDEIDEFPSALGSDRLSQTTLSDTIQAAFLATALPPDLKTEVQTELNLLQCTEVAVRSSAPNEDGESASFAGIFRSELGTPPEAVCDAIRRCWSSLFSLRALYYFARQNIDPRGAELALIIQRMLKPSQSGVCFTANPVSGCLEEVVVEVVDGLAEGLVGGQVTPGRIIYRKFRTPLDTEMPYELPRLSQVQLQTLTAAALSLERAFKAPQDIEFAFDGDTLYILQVRPITTSGGQLR